MAAPSTAVSTQWVGVSSRGRTYEIISCTFVSLSFVAVVLRLIARWNSFRRLLTDDYICIAAQVIAFSLMVIAILFTNTAGLGWHITQLPPLQAERFFKIFYAAEILYGVVTMLYKLAVVFLYRNIFAENRLFNISSWVMIALSVGWWISGFFTSLFQCSPIAKAWNVELPGTCVNKGAYILGLGISNLLIDVLILIMPMPMLWRLNLSGSRKLALSGMFLIGAVVCVASIFRITTLVPFNFTDPTYSLFEVAVWSEIEPSVGIIAACLPTLRQYFFKLIGERSRSRRGYTSDSKGGGTYGSTSKSRDGIPLSDRKSHDQSEDLESSASSNHKPMHLRPDAEAETFTMVTSFLDSDPLEGAIEPIGGDDRSILVKRETTVEVYE